MSKAWPSVSAILLCHDSEAWVGEALRAALGQDYPGALEILVSDDASSDGTWEIIERSVADYAGPHGVRSMRQANNTGSKSAHLNAVLPLATGEVFVSFDDDDVSVPDRVRRIAEVFRDDPRTRAVYSAFSRIDAEGGHQRAGSVPHPGADDEASVWFARVDAYAAGTTLAVHHSVVETFGPIDPAIHEDIVLPFRAALLGEVRYLPQPLVGVRRHATSLTADPGRFASIAAYRERMRAGIERAGRHLASRLDDLDTVEALMPERGGEWSMLREVACRSLEQAEATAGLVSSALRARISALFHLVREGAYHQELAQHAFLALFPRTYMSYKRRALGFGATATEAPSHTLRRFPGWREWSRRRRR